MRKEFSQQLSSTKDTKVDETEKASVEVSHEKVFNEVSHEEVSNEDSQEEI